MIKKVSANTKSPRRVINEKHLAHSFFITMKVSGYTKRKSPMKDWMRRDPDGRFHLVKFERGLWELHFDMDGIDCDHYSIRMPYKITKELIRIIGISNSLHQNEIRSQNNRLNQ